MRRKRLIASYGMFPTHVGDRRRAAAGEEAAASRARQLLQRGRQLLAALVGCGPQHRGLPLEPLRGGRRGSRGRLQRRAVCAVVRGGQGELRCAG